MDVFFGFNVCRNEFIHNHDNITYNILAIFIAFNGNEGFFKEGGKFGDEHTFS